MDFTQATGKTDNQLLQYTMLESLWSVYWYLIAVCEQDTTCLKRNEGKVNKENGFTSDHYGDDESRLFYTEENVPHLKYYHVCTCLGVHGRCWWDDSLVGFDTVGSYVTWSFGGLSLWRWRQCIPLECWCEPSLMWHQWEDLDVWEVQPWIRQSKFAWQIEC